MKTEIVEDFGLQSWEINIDGIIVDMERHQYPGAIKFAGLTLFALIAVLYRYHLSCLLI